MERITSKQVISMMEAVAQVYEQPEVEQLDEVSLNPMSSAEVREKAIERMRAQGMTQAQIDKALAAMDKSSEEKAADAKAAREKRDRQAPGGLGTAGGTGAIGQIIRSIQKTGITGDEGAQAARDYDAAAKILLKDPKNRGLRGELTASTEDIQREIQRIRDARFKKPETETETKPAETKPAETKPASSVPAGSFNISPEGSARRNEVEAQIKRDNAARTDDQRVRPRPAPKPQPTDQQKVRAEYDRLRNSKDPKERAQAVRYGRQMAAAGAAKKNFSGYQSAADAKKNLPAPAQRTSIAQRLQAIRDVRAASQSRIAAQGGTPATPAAKPKPKVAPPAPSTTSTSTTPTTTNKKLVNNGDPMERMTGKGAQSLKETYNSVYEERTEEKVIDEGIAGALKKVAKIGAAAAGAAAAGKALEKATSSKEPTRDEKDAADAKKHLDHYRKSGKMMRSEEKTAADPGMKARMGKEAPKKGGYKLPERTPANAKNVEYYKDDVDLFDIIKGHFIEEGLTEEEALAKMLDLTDEERTEIIEGSCGSKKKKKSKKGGY